MLGALLILISPEPWTPRAVLRVADISPMPFWRWTRRRRRNNAFVRFLGISVSMFDTICALCRPHLPRNLDPDTPRTRGPRPRFDYVDVVAMCLRRLQVNCSKQQEVIRIEFGGSAGLVSQLLSAGRPILDGVMTTWEPARIEYPSTTAAARALQAAVSLHHVGLHLFAPAFLQK